MLKSRAFKHLEEYRHCSIHRRPVYIETMTSQTRTSGTPGYATVGTVLQITVKRYLCTNPWHLRPNIDKKREIGIYCDELLEKIEAYVDRVIYHLP
jgi:hypothetical protein